MVFIVVRGKREWNTRVWIFIFFLITYLPTYERDEYIAALTRIVSGSTRRHGDERCVVNSDRLRHGRNIIVSTLRLLIGIPDYYLVGYVVYCVFIAGRQAGSL
jgi:hypothetical protein